MASLEPTHVKDPAPALGGVLIVADAGAERTALRQALTRAYPGLRVLEAADSGGLEERLEGGGFDLVITDSQMQGLDGLQVLKTVKRRQPDLPVIMFTASGGEELAVAALQNGLDDYVLKTTQPQLRLLASVQAVLLRAEQRAQQRQAEQTLRSLKQAVDTLPIGVTVVDTEGTILYTNPAEAAGHGYAVDELIGRPASMLVPRTHWQPRSSESGQVRRPWKRERLNVRKDGSTFPAQLISDVVRTPAGDAIGMVTTCEDISERKSIEAQLRRNAFYDPLTDLPNRALFMDRLRQAVERARRRQDYQFAVLFLDLDRFKLVNDSFGHTVGDQLLVAVARRLEKCLRPSDTVSRLGGDEFAILADETRGVADAVQIARRTLRDLGQAYHLSGQEVFTSASIGIAAGSWRYSDAEEVLRDADTVMYRAKAKGKARYEIFGQEMLADVREQLRLETELRRAVEREEFLLYYQPIVSLASGAVIGAEALLRWQHPERGLLLPADFLHVTEETGLIAPLTEWILRSACQRARAWRQAGFQELRLSVNLSPRQFRRGKVAKLIRRALEASGLPPQALELELTEGILMENAEASMRSLRELKELGMRLSVDDFGTGYSSLSYLKQLPVDTLKIDRSFVCGIGADARDAAIVSSVVALAHSLGLTVVAEGVESAEQVRFLRGVDCGAMQGFLFSRPLPADDFEPFLRSDPRLPEP